MARLNTDILISGGGVAGLCAAAAFGSAGFSVICVEPNAPITDAAGPGADLRTTAFLQPAIAVLQAAGLWDRLAPQACALQIMRIVDAGGVEPVARMTKDFDAADISDQPFGWNLPNWLLRREMLARIAELPNVTFMPGVATSKLIPRDGQALVSLSNGESVAARLVIAADGRASTMRAAAGIAVKTTQYGQKAVTFAVTHPLPHDNISTEIHRTGGPFTLVPLPDRGGLPCSAVVWMEPGPEAVRLAALPVAEFEAAINVRSCHVMGPLTLASPRMVWPIISQVADRMAGDRVALMAESAHVVPPIGAQGLNMSLTDLAVLLELATADRAGLGSPAMLQTYHRRRYADIRTRVMGIDALNRASMAQGQGLRDLRAGALSALYAATPLRKVLMKKGLGV